MCLSAGRKWNARMTTAIFFFSLSFFFSPLNLKGVYIFSQFCTCPTFISCSGSHVPGPLCIKCVLMERGRIQRAITTRPRHPRVVLERCVWDFLSVLLHFPSFKRYPEGDAPALESRDTHPAIINASLGPLVSSTARRRSSRGRAASFHVSPVMFYGCCLILFNSVNKI